MTVKARSEKRTVSRYATFCQTNAFVHSASRSDIFLSDICSEKAARSATLSATPENTASVLLRLSRISSRVRRLCRLADNQGRGNQDASRRPIIAFDALEQQLHRLAGDLL